MDAGLQLNLGSNLHCWRLNCGFSAGFLRNRRGKGWLESANWYTLAATTLPQGTTIQTNNFRSPYILNGQGGGRHTPQVLQDQYQAYQAPLSSARCYSSGRRKEPQRKSNNFFTRWRTKLRSSLIFFKVHKKGSGYARNLTPAYIPQCPSYMSHWTRIRNEASLFKAASHVTAFVCRVSGLTAGLGRSKLSVLRYPREHACTHPATALETVAR